jgi:hypothetical protein
MALLGEPLQPWSALMLSENASFDTDDIARVCGFRYWPKTHLLLLDILQRLHFSAINGLNA